MASIVPAAARRHRVVREVLVRSLRVALRAVAVRQRRVEAAVLLERAALVLGQRPRERLYIVSWCIYSVIAGEYRSTVQARPPFSFFYILIFLMLAAIGRRSTGSHPRP